MKSGPEQSDRSGLREFRAADAVWITTPEFEEAGRAAGFPDPAIVERWLAFDEKAVADGRGRAATRVEELPRGGPRVHVRRVLHGGWLGPLWRQRIAGLGRVRDELRVTAQLRAEGAPVVAAAFAIARRDGPLWRAAVCTEHVDGAADAIAFLRDRPDHEAVVTAARAAGNAVRSVQDRGLRHPDLHLGNLLLRRDATGFRAWVIDLDRARLGEPIGPARRRRELARLERSLEKRALAKALGDDGRAAFCRAHALEAADASG